MKIGLFVQPIHPPGRPLSESFDQDLKAIRMADKAGFSEAWVGEHMTLPWENIPSPELFIARASGETDQIAFGTVTDGIV